MSLQARLVVVGGDVKTSEIKLRLPCTVGRGRGSSIVLAHPLVSRQHCEIYEADGRLMVRDLGSLNGTFINNQRITEAATLPPNELLTIGTVTFRAVYDPAETAAEPAEEPAGSGAADTVFAGRAPTGSGTVPLFPGTSERATQPAEANPASQSSQIVLPPAAQLPASPPKGILPKTPAQSPPKDEAAEQPEEVDDRSNTDDDLQVFLKSLGKEEKSS